MPLCSKICASMNSRLVLGTAQFGLAYGVANRDGAIGSAAAAEIIGLASTAGIDTLDTAVAYGNSESRLGEIGIRGWKAISKIPAVPVDTVDVFAWVTGCVDRSLRALRVESLYGLLLHQPSQLSGPRGESLYRALLRTREDGKVGKIGVSIYSPEELDIHCARYQFDLVQAPMNVLDRRIRVSGWLAKLHDSGVEIHIRCVFLQGLLLLDRSHMPSQFSRWDSLWQRWHAWLEGSAVTPLQACLGFGLAQPDIDGVVVGVDSPSHMREILENARGMSEPPPVDLQSDDIDLIDPSRWRSH